MTGESDFLGKSIHPSVKIVSDSDRHSLSFDLRMAEAGEVARIVQNFADQIIVVFARVDVLNITSSKFFINRRKY
jgi:hypothetical protein